MWKMAPHNNLLYSSRLSFSFNIYVIYRVLNSMLLTTYFPTYFVQSTPRNKWKVLATLLGQMGVPTDDIKRFRLRSFRSGGAGQALINLAMDDRGIHSQDHVDTVARMLGHGTITRATMDAYIGHLLQRVMDAANVLFGREEGSAGGVAEMERRIARMTQYQKFASPDECVIEGRENGLSNIRCSLPPNIRCEVVDSSEVIAAKLAVDLAHRDLRREELAVKYVKNERKPSVDDTAAVVKCLDHWNMEKAVYSAIHRKAVSRASRDTEVYCRMKLLPPSVILKLCPDKLAKTLPLLREYSSLQDVVGEFTNHFNFR